MTARLARLVALVLTATWVLAGCGGSSSPHAESGNCPSAATATTPGPDAPPSVPARGKLVGAFALTGEATQSNYVASFDALQSTTCSALPLAHVYWRWNAPFPSQSARDLADAGHDLLVSWTGTDLAAMADGSEDAAIVARARQIASLGHPVFLELRWEMDRPNLAGVVHSPATYISAWDRTRRLFAQVGVRNVSWVWCPTSGAFDDGRAQQYYPGANEVDWICTDVYPSSQTGTQFPSFAHLVRPFLDWAKPQGKPLMIGEFGIPQSFPASQRAAWLDATREFLDKAPSIKALLYFDYADPGTIPSHDYSLGTDPPVTAAFHRLAAVGG